MIDEEKICSAIEEVTKLIDSLSEPEKMSREEALDFYSGLIDEISIKSDALEEVRDG